MTLLFPDKISANGPFAIADASEIAGAAKIVAWDAGVTTPASALAAAYSGALAPDGTMAVAVEANTSVASLHVFEGGLWVDLVDKVYGVDNHAIVVQGSSGQGFIDISEASGWLWDGSRFVASGVIDVPVTANTNYIIYYSKSANGYVIEANSLGPVSIDGYVPVAMVAIGSVGDVVDVIDCQPEVSGHKSLDHVVVGAKGQFQTLRRAMAWMSCFQSQARAPKKIVVAGNILEPFRLATGTTHCISLDAAADPLFSEAGTRLQGLEIVGGQTQSAGHRPKILFGAAGANGHLIDCAGVIGNFTIDRIGLIYEGDTNAASDDVVVFKNPGRGFKMTDCQFLPGTTGKLTHGVSWENGAGDIELGGNGGSDTENGVMISEIHTRSGAFADTSTVFHALASGYINGALSLNDCTIAGWTPGAFASVVECSAGLGAPNLVVAARSVNVSGCMSLAFDLPTDAVFTADAVKFFSTVSGTSYQDVSVCESSVSNSFYKNTSGVALGAAQYNGCKSLDGNVSSANTSSSMVNCDFGSLSHDGLLEPSHIISLRTWADPNSMIQTRSYVIDGLVLSNINSTLNVTPGVGFCNSIVIGISSLVGIAVKATSSWVNSDTPPSIPAWAWAFLRSDGSVKLSHVRPFHNHLGSTTPDTGFTVNDYIFVGSFYITAFSADVSAAIHNFTRIGNAVHHPGGSFSIISAITQTPVTASQTLIAGACPNDGTTVSADAVIFAAEHYFVSGTPEKSIITFYDGNNGHSISGKSVLDDPAGANMFDRSVFTCAITSGQFSYSANAVAGGVSRSCTVSVEGYIEKI